MTTEAPLRPSASDGGPGPAEGEVSAAVPFPRYSIALVQNESEMLQAPSCDIHTFLQHDPVFDVELFTERSFRSLPDESTRFDCIVIGYNAAYKSAVIREALMQRAPRTGLCVLHQLEPAGLSFLEPALALRKFREPAHRLHMARGREPRDEFLLNWPERVPLDGDVLSGASAHGGLVPGPDTSWRAVLETEHGGRSYPVLLRSPTASPRQLAVCTALLSQARSAQAALLKNIIAWCAAGRPEVVVVETPGDPRSAVVHRKLRLQGAKAIAHEVPSEGELDFDTWPFRGVGNVILPPGWDPLASDGPGPARGVHDWLDRDGRIVSVESDGSLLIRHGASDARWVARQWAGWFAGQPTTDWHGEHPRKGSIVRTRAVLRTLVELRRRIGEETADGLGLPRPSDFAERCSALLHARLGRTGTNVDGTVSATTAALEIDRAIGGEAIGSIRALAIKRWLRERARDLDERGRPVLAAEDRLEVARCLGDGELTLQVARDLAAERDDPMKPLAAILVTKLREAVVTSGLEPGQLPDEITRAPRSVEPDVRESPLLAANYLIAWSELRQRWPAGASDPLAEEPPEALDRAIISVGKQGVLVTGRSGTLDLPHELVSAEALALLAYFEQHKAATHMLPGAGATPPEALTALVHEARELRQQNAALPGLERAVFWGKWIVGIVAVVIVTALTVLVERSGLTLPVFADLTTPLAAAVLLLATRWALKSIGLLADWLEVVVQWVRERAGLSRGEQTPPAEPRTGGA
jgi:hypothetical protein